MRSDQLRARQAPLKELYRKDPASAVLTLKAEGQVGQGITCSVQTGRALVEAGLHPATGGPGTQLCSGDMLLQALVACAGVTLGAVAAALEVPFDSARVRAEGDLDFRGTLGVDRQAPVGFKAIRLIFSIDSDATVERLNKVIELTERYCVVYQTLRNSPPVTVSLDRL